jgi:hypothetical protein
MALEVLNATGGHERSLEPFEREALVETTRAHNELREPDAEHRRIHDQLLRDFDDRKCVLFCDCLPQGRERPAIAIVDSFNDTLRLQAWPFHPVQHDPECVFAPRLPTHGTTRHYDNPLSPRRHGAPSLNPDWEYQIRRRPFWAIPTLATILIDLMALADLYSIACHGGFAAPADWLRALQKGAERLRVGPDVAASHVLTTDPASWNSGEFLKLLDERTRDWPDAPPPCGFLCWLAHDIDEHQINPDHKDAGYVRVTSTVATPLFQGKRVSGPYIFLGALQRTLDGSAWECSMACALPILSQDRPNPVNSDYERTLVLALPKLVDRLQNNPELREILGGTVSAKFYNPMDDIEVRGGPCRPNAILTITHPKRVPPYVEKTHLADPQAKRYVFDVAHYDDAEYEAKREITRRNMRRIGYVIRLHVRLFRASRNSLDKQLQTVARQIAKDLIYHWAGKDPTDLHRSLDNP